MRADAPPTRTDPIGMATRIQQKKAIQEALRSLPLFCEMEPALFETLVETARVLEVRRNDIILHQGQQVTSMYCVISGQVKLVVASPTGAEKVIELIGPSRSFGEALMFLKRPSPVTAQALIKSTVVEIGARHIFEAIERSPEVAHGLLAGLSMRLHHLVSDLETCCLQNSTERVVRFLLEHRAEDDHVQLPAHKNLIASRLNLAPESFSRILHLLTDKGLIRVQGRDITLLDPDRLRREL